MLVAEFCTETFEEWSQKVGGRVDVFLSAQTSSFDWVYARNASHTSTLRYLDCITKKRRRAIRVRVRVRDRVRLRSRSRLGLGLGLGLG